MEEIFLDNNGTTPLDPRVREVMMEELSLGPANPSSIHRFGQRARARLTEARESVASYFSVSPQELIFTGSGTEALNLAILGTKVKGKILTSPLEHPAVYNTLSRLETPLIYLPTDPSGAVQIEDLKKALTDDVGLIVLMAVNNETGVKNPIDEIAALALERKIPFVVDGVALLGKETFSIHPGISAIAFSGHKIHGPKGVGLLIARKNYPLTPLITGGAQERMRRGGTENMVGIRGMATAIALLKEELPETTIRMERLRDLLEEGLAHAIVNGKQTPRICNTSSLTFPGCDGESLLIQLDQLGIAASMGSACSAGALEPSRVLLEMGLSRKEALSTLRFSLSRTTTEDEIRKTVAALMDLTVAKV